MKLFSRIIYNLQKFKIINKVKNSTNNAKGNDCSVLQILNKIKNR